MPSQTPSGWLSLPRPPGGPETTHTTRRKHASRHPHGLNPGLGFPRRYKLSPTWASVDPQPGDDQAWDRVRAVSVQRVDLRAEQVRVRRRCAVDQAAGRLRHDDRRTQSEKTTFNSARKGRQTESFEMTAKPASPRRHATHFLFFCGQDLPFFWVSYQQQRPQLFLAASLTMKQTNCTHTISHVRTRNVVFHTVLSLGERTSHANATQQTCSQHAHGGGRMEFALTLSVRKVPLRRSCSTRRGFSCSTEALS